MSYKETIDLRQNQIHQWLKTILPSPDYQMEPASNDASFRRYFRITQHGNTWIVMDAPPEHEDTTPFIKIAEFLHSQGINVPRIHAKQSTLGFLLLSDLGNTQYLDKLTDDSAPELYQSAINELIQFQYSDINHIELPQYDAALLKQEMLLFPEWFLGKHLNIDPPEFLETIYQTLIESALEQPRTFVHRDYHSRNLMVTNDDQPGVIDFQDAVIGPISYDLVSLLRDCYIAWPDDKINSWINYYLSNAQHHGLLSTVSTERFTRWFDLMGLQRHIKILGIFARLNYRDNKPNYMNDLPLTLRYVHQISQKYPELAELSGFLEQQPQIATIL
ncbi:MAG: aminoglycoside phosphotransferase family protein [Methylophagaceae bacterium]